MTDSDAPEWPDPADEAHAIEQAKRLRNQVAEGGLRFEAYLPSELALGELKELAPHADLRRELFKRSIQAAADDPRPGIPSEEVGKHLLELRKEPARWEKRS